MKYINIDRTDDECFNNVINVIKNAEYKYEKNRKKSLQIAKKLPIKEIRYMDNQYRIYDARENWVRLIQHVIVRNILVDVIDLLP